MSLPDWVEPVARYMFQEGLRGTLRIAVISVVASTVIGVVLGTLLTIRFWPTRALIRFYIEVWRSRSQNKGCRILLIADQFEFDPFTAATIGLTLWGSAQVAEATRGAVQSIPREQHEAASALGFGWVGRHVYVILPQALRRLIPPLVSLLVAIILNSTLAQIIGANELLESAERSVERLAAPPPSGQFEIHAIEIYGAVMVVFFLICFPLTRLAAYLERKLVA